MAASAAAGNVALVAGTTLARYGRGVILTGRSGSGKSDLALRAIANPIILPGEQYADASRAPTISGVPFELVSDDQTEVRSEGSILLASPPPAIRDKLEVRGIGIVDFRAHNDVPLLLIAELCDGPIERLPEFPGARRTISGIALDIVQIQPFEASAPIKLALALARAGNHVRVSN